MTTDIVIYHNPECGTSRNALAMIRNAGIEPHVIEYLKTPPSRPLLESLIDRAGIGARALLRERLASRIESSARDTFGFAGARCDAVLAHVMADLARLGLLRAD